MNATNHPTLFMIDQFYSIPMKGECQYCNFKEFLKEEPEYDAPLFKGIKYIYELSQQAPTNQSEALFAIVEKIHECVVEHLPIEKKESCKEAQIGPKFHTQAFPILKSLCTDEEGLRELIEDISDQDQKLGLNLAYCPEDTKEYDKKNLINIDLNSDIPFTFFNQEEEFFLVSTSKHENRKQYMLEAAENYFVTLQSASSIQEKIEAIAVLCRRLLQLHYFEDGNGRMCYLLANLLMLQNGLSPFYPAHMCIFDANSKARMVKLIEDGIPIFQNQFGSIERLIENLQTYFNVLEKVSDLIQQTDEDEKECYLKYFKSRNFEALLRKVTQSNSDINIRILSFLIENAIILNIDLFAKSNYSGENALEVAIDYENELGKELLSTFKSEKEKEWRSYLKEEQTGALFDLILQNPSLFEIEACFEALSEQFEKHPRLSEFEKLLKMRYSEKLQKLYAFIEEEQDSNLTNCYEQNNLKRMISILKRYSASIHIYWDEFDEEQKEDGNYRLNKYEKMIAFIENNAHLFEKST